MTADAVGGVWTYACELVRGLAPHGVRFSLATMGGALPEDRRAEAARLPATEVHESSYRLEWMDEPWEDVAAAGEWLLALGRDVEADLVHLNGYAHATLPWGAPVLVVAHSCVETWWRAVRGSPAPPRYDRYRDAVRRGLAAADAVVSPTAAHWRAVAAAYGNVPEARIILNGIDPAPFDSSRFRGGRSEPRFLAVGRVWDEAKNLAALEAVAPRLPWPVVLAGAVDAPDRNRTEESPAGDGGGSSSARGARRLGRLSAAELRCWYAASPILVHPARYEPFGLVPLEAALTGCALVLGDLPTLREVWGAAARYVAPDDEGALAGALEELAADPARRRDLAARARRRGRALSRDRMAAATGAVYRDLTGGATSAIGASGAAGRAP